jgi:hypothetical protein
MRKTNKNLTLSVALAVLAAGVPAFTAQAQPRPAELPVPPPMDLHVRVVPEAPPPLRAEVVIPRPGPNHVWVKGYWHHDGAAWAWMDGRWIEPPRPHVRWITARYERVDGGTRYIPGHWSHEKVIYK